LVPCPAANEIEQLTLRRLAEANLSAVLAALANRFPDYGESGVRGLTFRPAIYLTGESHHSFVKIARMTGLGMGSIHEVPTDNDHALDSTWPGSELVEDPPAVLPTADRVFRSHETKHPGPFKR
jgi:hypothetical protein